ncbi:MAG: type II secretion system ATPase GspE [Desulfobacterales bacterium]
MTTWSELLTRRFGLPAEAVAAAEAQRREKGGRLEEILLQQRVLTEEQLLEATAERLGVDFWPRLPPRGIDPALAARVPTAFLKKHGLVPLRFETPVDAAECGLAAAGTERAACPAGWVVAMRDLQGLPALDDLVRLLGLCDYKIVLSTREAILAAIHAQADLSRDSAEQLVQNLEENGATILSGIEETADLLEDASDAPVIKLVNHIISQSVKARASDIHFEPYQNSFTVRYRVDGILYDLLTPPKWIQPALISRVKVMAKMNIAEKRLPQDGRFDVRVGDQDIDVRVSTVPTAFGERLVLRLLNKSGSLLKITELGLSAARLETLRWLSAQPNGIVLVTGPTGSGKTTTLYAILQSINQPGINIITIEDPIEYQIKGISQIQVNPKIDLTFARGLRSIVRQDPDVILIGEIRDKETADIAVQSALTGHLVFSTLHTNDSPSAITRLVDIGVEPFLISSSVLAVLAQRLVRVLCTDCKQPYAPPTVYLQSIGLRPERFAEKPIFKAVGCEKCFQTGYRGRIGIFEIMRMSEELKSLIIQTYDANRIKALAVQEGMVTLREDGIEKVLEGQTTLEEVLRVTQG